MRYWQAVTLAIGTIAVTAGCSQSLEPSAQPASSALAPTAMLPKDRWPKGHPYVVHPEPNAKRGRIYSSSFGGDSVTYYLKGTGPNNPVAGTLSGTFENPQGMAIDPTGNLYVSNGNASEVLVYPPGASSPSTTLTDPVGFPVDVAIGSDGTVYVANVWASMGNPGSVAVYAPGATTPTSVLRYQGFVQVAGVALDRSGNVFVSYDQSNGKFGTVAEFPAGSSNPVATNISVGAVGGIGFDNAGHMLLVDQEAPSLNVYTPGTSTPIAKLALPGVPIYFSFGKHGKNIFFADYSLGEIDVFNYTPSKLTQINKITNGIIPSNTNVGVATSPQ
jgi:hypothetical protein